LLQLCCTNGPCTYPFTVAPKLFPRIVTAWPTPPDVADRLVITGGGITVNATPLLATPPTVTTRLPVVVPEGTGTLMNVGDQYVGVATVPLNLTVLLPCNVPKPAPLHWMDAPTLALDGDKVLIPGPGVTVKLTPLLAVVMPPTVTTTLPVVAPSGTDTTICVCVEV
jgi:hypothetical protein